VEYELVTASGEKIYDRAMLASTSDPSFREDGYSQAIFGENGGYEVLK
jgi:hypothetical protein